MSLPVILSPDAEADFEEAYDYYEGQQAGLGARFEAAVRTVTGRLSVAPLAHARVFGEVRRARVHGFRHYVMHYVVEASRVYVISVFHTSRDPAIWQSRV